LAVKTDRRRGGRPAHSGHRHTTPSWLTAADRRVFPTRTVG